MKGKRVMNFDVLPSAWIYARRRLSKHGKGVTCNMRTSSLYEQSATLTSRVNVMYELRRLTKPRLSLSQNPSASIGSSTLPHGFFVFESADIVIGAYHEK
jgi:hypothetical protein